MSLDIRPLMSGERENEQASNASRRRRRKLTATEAQLHDDRPPSKSTFREKLCHKMSK